MSERRRGLQANGEDFLQRLLDEDDKACNGATTNGGGLTDEEIQDNILTMIIAGQDTTASAMTWMVKFLDENPEVLDTLLVREKAWKFFLLYYLLLILVV